VSRVPQSVPVFALPDVVLFPHAPLPLHVFELRYRTMVRDVLSGGRMFALALLRSGWERDYKGNPPLHPLACLARIDQVEWLVNDCYDLTVTGTVRVELGRTVRDYPYRSMTVHAREQEPFSGDDPLVELEQRALVASVERFAEHGTLHPAVAEALDPRIGYEQLVNRVAMHLDLTPFARLALLADDSVVRRGHRVRELLEEHLRRPVRKGDGGWN
jgi:Lon protease-like protein